MMQKLKLLESFIIKNSKCKSNRVQHQKVINKKGDQLYVRRKGYDNSLNSWIDKKEIVVPYPVLERKVELDLFSYTINLNTQN